MEKEGKKDKQIFMVLFYSCPMMKELLVIAGEYNPNTTKY